jgi:hypothetical protein
MEDRETIVLWGRTPLGWLCGHLPYANGIPCEDRFRRVFGRLGQVALEHCLIEWMARQVRRGNTWRSTADGTDRMLTPAGKFVSQMSSQKCVISSFVVLQTPPQHASWVVGPRRSVKFRRVWSLQIPPPDDRRLS